MKNFFSILFLLITLVFSVSAQSLFPANGSIDAPYDAQLQITFDKEITLDPDTKIEIYDSEGNLIDTIYSKDEVQVFADGSKKNVGSQLIRKDKNTIFITPHNYKLLPSTTYVVKFPEIEQWSFTTKAAPQNLADGSTITVNNSIESTNNANFYSIQAALDFVSNTKGNYTISIAPGIYYELLHYNGEANITLQGPKDNNRGNNLIIQYINCNDLNKGQKDRVSFYFNGQKSNLIIENLTFINLADSEKVYSSALKFPSGNAQAETLFFHNGKGHTLTVYNSSFMSHQDTLQISGKCWFYNCYISGDVDFIWGYADVALFEECEINCLRYKKDRAYIFECRVGLQTEPIVPKGFVLFNSAVNVEKRQNAFYARRATTIEKAKTPYYDQCAIVNVQFKGEGNVNPMKYYVGKPPRFEGDCTNIGWKEYNVTFDELKGTKPSAETADKRYKDAADISKKLYKKEYSNRDVILNRSYNKDTGKYQEDTDSYWDINQLIKDRNYNVKEMPKSKKGR